jgi:hypothetical protein
MPRNRELALVLALAAFGCAGTAQKEPEHPQPEVSGAPDTVVSQLPLENASAAESTAGASDLAELPPATLGEPQKEVTRPGSEPSRQTTQVMCPMSVQGAAVTRTDISGGVRLDFKAPAARLEELRSRVHYLSNIYSGPLGLYDNQAITNLRYIVVSDDSAEGASITFRAQDKSGVDSLRAQVQRHAAAMQSSGMCLMLSDVERSSAP